MVFFGWIVFVGVVCVEFLCVRNFEYVCVVKVLGVSNWMIMFCYMLLNVMVVMLIMLLFIVMGMILIFVGFDFFGFGLLFLVLLLGELMF